MSNRAGTTWQRWRRWQRALAEPGPAGVVPDGSPPTVTVTTDPDPIQVEAHLTPEMDRLVPRGMQTAASWCWRAIVIVIVIGGLGWLIGYLSEVVIPLAVAILLTALLGPVARRLRGWGLPKGLAIPITVIGGLAVVAGGLTLIGTQIAGQSGAISNQVVAGFNQIVDWLSTGPLNVNTDQLNGWIDKLQAFLTDSSSTIAKYAADVGTQLGRFVAGFAITIFALFYFLGDGRGIFRFLLKFFPRRARGRVDDAALKGWVSLTSYVRATILVALTDAVGVLIAALIIGVPLAPALAALVFIGAFVPIVGALVSGMVAVLVALVFLGWVKALIMLACIIAVMQLEGHILQPFLLGRAVKLHPLAVLLGIAIGVIVAGIVGALMSIPILAFSKTFVADLAVRGGEDLDPGAVTQDHEKRAAR
ncbi:MAG: AI-2E family transporter [Propionibacteriaceae bacterium]